MRKYLTIMRPGHWSKNVFVLAAVIFGKKFIGPADEVLLAFGSAIGGFLCFCLASSAIYIFNDIVDRASDMEHPEKRKRPIASGEVTVVCAAVLSVVCALVAVGCGYQIDKSFAIIILVYIGLMVLYSMFLKRVMILDCIVISIGFCLRAVAGAIIVGVFISPWLIICTFTLCLFMGFSKRCSEIVQLGENSENFRKTLAGYTPGLVSHMVDVTSGLAIVCFLLYAMDSRTMTIFGSNDLVYTTPFVLYCIFRFSALIQKGKFMGPAELILADRPFQIGIVLWVLSCVGIIYANKMGMSLTGLWAY